ncbi:MAG: hypothetical protein WC222_09940 [Parachlamydiales bacterium]|jgi:hypothetical protein
MTDLLRKFAFIALTTLCFSSTMHADEFDCCNDPCIDEVCVLEAPYCGTPLNEGNWNISIKGGIAPSIWMNRGNGYVVIPTNVPPVLSSGQVKSYQDLFDMPWAAGLEIAYNSTGHTQYFIEGLYRCSPNKTVLTRTFPDTQITIRETMDDGKDWFGYFGVRQFFCRDWICDSVAPYIGFKAGFVHHQKIRIKVTENASKAGSFTLFESTTGVSAGLFLGLDCALMECLSLQLQSDVLVSQAIQGKRNIVLPAVVENGATNIIAGRVNTEITFPITVALRYSF